MVFCPSCGQEIAGRDRYCSKCGEQVRDLPEDATSPSTDSDESDQKKSSTEPNDAGENFLERSLWTRVAAGGAVLVILGAFLPWVSASVLGMTVVVTGIEGDGIYTALGATIAVVIIGLKWTPLGMFVSILSGGGISLLGTIYILDPLVGVEGTENEFTQAIIQTRIGLYLTLLGGIMIISGSYLELITSGGEKKERSESTV